MSSTNISINDEVYKMLKGLKKEDESFSDVIKSLVKDKDISKCYGILSDYSDDLVLIETEAFKARKQKWKKAEL